MTVSCFPPVLLRISMGRLRPLTLIVPFSARVFTFRRAAVPPTASTYFVMISSAGGALTVELPSPETLSVIGLGPPSAIMGMAEGRGEPRWQELQVTVCFE